MSEPASPPPLATGRPEGVTASVLLFIGSLARHLQALFALFGCESREAAEKYLRFAIFLGAALLCFTLGYLFLVLTLVFILTSLFGLAWGWSCLIVAALHLALAWGFAYFAREYLRQPSFQNLGAEIKKDWQALQSIQP